MLMGQSSRRPQSAGLPRIQPGEGIGDLDRRFADDVEIAEAALDVARRVASV
jgi:hypothetical protein